MDHESALDAQGFNLLFILFFWQGSHLNQSVSIVLSGPQSTGVYFNVIFSLSWYLARLTIEMCQKESFFSQRSLHQRKKELERQMAFPIVFCSFWVGLDLLSRFHTGEQGWIVWAA